MEDLLTLVCRAAANHLHSMRKQFRTHPEGRVENGRCWYPSQRENCGGSGSKTRAPTWRNPWTYMLKCRSRAHTGHLIYAAMLGDDVPSDAKQALGTAWRVVITGLAAGSMLELDEKFPNILMFADTAERSLTSAGIPLKQVKRRIEAEFRTEAM